MAITVTMIEEKEFKTKVRGYDPIEVDEFLDDICDEMIDMQNVI
ncbi:MAG: DivIVA domain-containing protein, partial [Clostridiales bacterium]|nr:DivIVA domain-containing protein [Clostridiales bacterium]